MTVLIVEDEPLARRQVRRIVSTLPGVEQIMECTSGPEAVDYIISARPDLVVLDVSLPGFDGFEVIRRVGLTMPPVVFLTAYDAYAIRAFEVSAIDYVLKPYAPNRIRAAVQRGLTQLHDRDAAHAFRLLADARLTAPRPASSSFLRRFVATAGKRGVVIGVDEIAWIEADDYCVKIHTDTSSAVVRETMEAVEAQLDPEDFVRVHRTAIVRLDAVRGLKRAERTIRLLLKNGGEIAVARSRVRLVVNALRGREG